MESTKTVQYLRSLSSVRETCQKVYALAKANQTLHFSLNLERLKALASHIIQLMQETYPAPLQTSVPFHSRWRHFESGDPARVSNMMRQWDCDAMEKTRRLLDLAIVSVLLDAGAGMQWTYREKSSGKLYSRSEGLAIASLEMFKSGCFSSEPQSHPFQVDAKALMDLEEETLLQYFQVDEKTNPLAGYKGRMALMKRLGQSLMGHPAFTDAAGSKHRPGFLVDYAALHNGNTNEISMTFLWTAVMDMLKGIWPDDRTNIGNENMGDVWSLEYLSEEGKGGKYVSFHKLSQWLTYSLIEPLQSGGFTIIGLELMTGLPEYRNGGLLIDFQVLIPKNPYILKEEHASSAQVIVEWRALTVAVLDELHDLILARLELTNKEFPLVKMLEGGTWKAGRIIAKEKRADGGPPIRIISDGTVF